MNYLDLFSGIGGFALGAYWAGWRFDRHYFSEIDLWCCGLYQKRFPDAVPLGDITKIDGKALVADPDWPGFNTKRKRGLPYDDYPSRRNDTDGCDGAWILTGGFPCQDISTAGKGAGITGARSGLWFEYARLIGEIRPRYAIMENVGALTRRGLDRVLGSLAEVGYDAEWTDIRASDVGAPHRRERIWIVAYPGSNRRYSGDGWGTLSDENGNGTSSIRGSLKQSGIGCCREDVADAEYSASARQRGYGGEGLPIAESERLGACGERAGDWSTESGIRRVASRIPNRVDRLKGLGNSIVPQIAEIIFRQLAERWE